jgi:hypothetical protein
MALRGDILSFYYEKDFKQCYLSFKWGDIVCVNKRQFNIFDIRTISIHYKRGSKLNELRLKCAIRSEVDKWI